MKKICLLILGLLLIPTVAFAAEDPNVDTVTATASGSTITYSGTVVNDSIAVMCKLYDSNGNEVTKYSSAVNDDKFNGEFIVDNNGSYEVRCANYEGGIVKGAEVTVSDIPTVTNAKTGDAIMIYVAILAISVVGAGLGTFYLVKKSKQ